MSAFVISAHDVDELERGLFEHLEVTDAIRRQAQAEVLADARAKAASLPAWSGIEIDTWDEFDRTWIGVRGQEFVSASMVAEYGTEDAAPSPLIRLLDDSVMRATQRAAGRTAAYYGAF